MSWHNFRPSEGYLLTKVLTICEQRIAEGHVVATDQKRDLLESMRQHAPVTVVFSPFSTGLGSIALQSELLARSGWSASSASHGGGPRATR
jgi:hypothetical protein